MRLNKFTLLAIVGTTLQVIAVILNNILKVKGLWTLYLNYLSTTLLLIFFIGFFFKQTNRKTTLKKTTLIAIIGQILILLSMFQKK